MIAMLMIMGLTHKQAYRDNFVVTVLVPLVAVLGCIAFLSVFYAIDSQWPYSLLA